MVENLVNFFLGLFSNIKSMPYLIVFIISMIPILELRGGILAASSMLCLDPIKSFIVCIIGNIIPIPFILWFITPLFDKLKKTKKLSKIVVKLENTANKKKDKIERLKYIGLFLFVGIPLPGTGAWTGCLIAALLGMDKKKSLLAASLGVVLAGIIMIISSLILNKATGFCTI